MSVNDATNGSDASNSADDAQNIEAPKKSGKKLKLLCNPQRLPKPKIPKATLPDEKEMSIDTKYAVRDYFFKQKYKAIKKARERGWI